MSEKEKKEIAEMVETAKHLAANDPQASFETKAQLDDRIVRAAGLKPPIYLGIPGKAQIRKIAEKYYKDEEK